MTYIMQESTNAEQLPILMLSISISPFQLVKGIRLLAHDCVEGLGG